MFEFDEIVRRSRARGLRVTPQRLAVYRVLALSHDHPDPDALHRRLLPELPSISLATVYKTLDALAAMGLVRQVPVAGAAKRYDANLDHHHHLLCERCRSVADVYDAGLDRLAVPKGLDGFEVRQVSVQLLGICAACARKANKGQAGAGQKTRRTLNHTRRTKRWQSRSREPRRIRT